MKKIICLTLVFVMLLSALVSCGGDGTQTDVSSDAVVGDTDAVSDSEEATVAATEATTEAETEAPVVISEYDLSKFRIVYNGSHLADMAEEIKTKIKETTGLELDVVSSDDAKDEGGNELIIGRTDREISGECFNDFTTFKYSKFNGIYCKNGKVQLLGIDRITIRDSMEYFFENAFAEGKTTIAIPEQGALAEEINAASYDIPAKADSSYLRVVTNNILMHSLTDKWGVPATQNRMSELMGAYSLYDADIILFQEVDGLWYSIHKLVDNMKSLGYTYAANTSMATLSSAVFYKTSRFDLVETDSIIYDSSMLPGGPLEGRRYTYAVLEEKATGKKVVASSTHFVASLTGVDASVCDLYRQESAKQLLAFAESMEAKYPGAVVIMGGDYNSNLESEAHRIMFEGVLSARDKADKKVNLNYATSCSGVGKKPKRGNPPSVIDHIFYSKSGLTAKHYEVLISRYSYAYADHVPVLVDFELN